ncbi:hypothetical protein GYMLUDRAFT_252105 [Collybiopsis luxurians FD-317 M1]|uniref:Uncharacterized protein n=1 Tax=Collybiopsis luxurians FD-317 M1 TaxID=944289 RepID=A0A0D0BPA5_9AGAR|nr:hypothetical protein GYMLUDRAFT_252105 [Collybiopsis luxurians FD-317 M1]
MTDDYPDAVNVASGITMTFEPQLRVVKISGKQEDDIFYVPTHWHEGHDEIIAVREGKLKVTLGSEVKSVSCVFTESTNPKDFETKELFFRNLFAMPGGMSASLLPAMQVYYYGDIFPVFPIHSSWLEKAFVIVLGGYLAPLLGYHVRYKTLKKI